MIWEEQRILQSGGSAQATRELKAVRQEQMRVDHSQVALKIHERDALGPMDLLANRPVVQALRGQGVREYRLGQAITWINVRERCERCER